MFKRILVAAVLFGTAATAPPAAAQSVCANRDELTGKLSAKYSEQLVSAGLQSASGLVEVWTSSEGATWTILMSRPDGISCIVASGTDWYSQEPQAPLGTPS